MCPTHSLVGHIFLRYCKWNRIFAVLFAYRIFYHSIKLSCENGCFEGACDNGTKGAERFVRGPLCDVLTTILNAAPHIINEEDAGGLSALEYAIHNGVDDKVYYTLQEASEVVWKTMAPKTSIVRNWLLQREKVSNEEPIKIKKSKYYALANILLQ